MLALVEMWSAAAAPETDGGTSSTSTSTTADPVNKKRRSVLFASYEKQRESDDQPMPSRSSSESTVTAAVLHYLSISSPNSKAADPWAVFNINPALHPLKVFYELVFCCPASSCPVDRVFIFSSDHIEQEWESSWSVSLSFSNAISICLPLTNILCRTNTYPPLTLIILHNRTVLTEN